MPWAKQSITINGESVEAMAKVSSENGTGSVELPFDDEDKYKLDSKVTIHGKDYTVRAVVSRHEELTVLDLIEIPEVKELKIKVKKKKETDDDISE